MEKIVFTGVEGDAIEYSFPTTYTAVKDGSAAIKFYSGSTLLKTLNVDIVDVSISLSPASGTETFTGAPAQTTTISGVNLPSSDTFSCESSNEDIATCSISGNTMTVTPGMTGGEATITVIENTYHAQATYTINVIDAQLIATPSFLALVMDGESKEVVISGPYLGNITSCTPADTDLVTCTISGTTLTVTPKSKEGSTSITIHEDGKDLSLTFNVRVSDGSYTLAEMQANDILLPKLVLIPHSSQNQA